jgi:hypothetical protein
MSTAFEDSIRSSFKNFANKLYEDIIEKFDAIIAEKNNIISELETRQNVDNESYNKVSMITRQDKEIKLLKERNAELERELISARSNSKAIVQPVVSTDTVLAESDNVVVVEKQPTKPRAKTTKKEKNDSVVTDEKVKTRGRKKKTVEEPVTVVDDAEIPVDDNVKVAEISEAVQPVDDNVKVAEISEDVQPVDDNVKVAEISEDRPNINDLDIIDDEGVDYYLNPVSNKIYEMTASGDLGTCIGEKQTHKIIFY